ncbi:hypothetical protein AB0O20_02580 [Streptomyces kronopolitis]|uniref:hypothetical protein n=1 Tax=Streptomyces kronopolitis TaxID=1612435 RepID=UPI003425E528
MPPADLATALEHINWDNPRQCAADTRTVLRALAHDRALLTSLVTSIGSDPDRLARCETNPLINRLVLAEDTSGADQWQLRLHVFQDGRLELIPHDHKYPFAVHVLTGGYAQVWNRRTVGRQTGPFTSADLAPGLVTVEPPGAAYLFSDSLVHQTAVFPGTTTLFLRGPERQTRWNSATDMHDTRIDGEDGSPTDQRYRLSGPMSLSEYHAFVADLERLGVLTSGRITS